MTDIREKLREIGNQPAGRAAEAVWYGMIGSMIPWVPILVGVPGLAALSKVSPDAVDGLKPFLEMVPRDVTQVMEGLMVLGAIVGGIVGWASFKSPRQDS